ncbi:leucine-rich repeat containing protein, putative, partial [Entamoeba invadens IP1]
MKKALFLLQKYAVGKSVNLYREANPFIVILVIKLYFLSLSQSFFCVKLVDEIELSSHKDTLCSSFPSPIKTKSFASSGSEDRPIVESLLNSKMKKEANEVTNCIKQFLEDDEKNVFDEILSVISSISEKCGVDESVRAMRYFVGCMSPDFTFSDDIIKQIFAEKKDEKRVSIPMNDSEEAYDGEVVRCIFDCVKCPLCFLTEPLKMDETTIPGKLAVTTYRVMFTPNVKLNNSRKSLMGRVAQCPIGNIIEKKLIEQTEGKTQYHILRIVTSTFLVLTFLADDDIFRAVDACIDEVLTEGVLPVFINGLGVGHVNVQEGWIKRNTRNGWEDKMNKDCSVLPKNAPLFETQARCTEMGRLIFSCYLMENTGATLLRLTTPSKKNILNELTVEQGSKIKFDIMPLDLQGVENFEKLFDDIRSKVVYGKDAKEEFQKYTEKVEEVNGMVDYCFKKLSSVLYVLNRGVSCLIVPKNLRETDIGIFVALIEILTEPYFRTIEGMIEIIHCEFSSMKYDFEGQKNSFAFFIVVLLTIYKSFPKAFEYNRTFIEYIFHHSTSHVFTDFNMSDTSSLSEYVKEHFNDFKNVFFEEMQDTISISLITVKTCGEVFYKTFCMNSQVIYKILQPQNTPNEIDLQGMELYFFPLFHNFPSLENVTKLCLRNNNLSSFPSEINQFIHIKNIDLSKNKISRISDIICECTNLTLLDISDNQILYLPRRLTSMKLFEINLNGNSPSQTPFSLYFPSMLQKLSLKSYFFPTNISSVNLTSLDIGSNFLEPDFMHAIPKSVVELGLSSCLLEHLPTLITKLTNLEVLDISENPIASFPPAFFTLKNIKIVKLLKTNFKQLSYLFGQFEKLEKVEVDESVVVPALLSKIFPERLIKEKLPRKSSEDVVKVYFTGDGSQKDVLNLLVKKTSSDKESVYSIDKNTEGVLLNYEDIEQTLFDKMKSSVFVICLHLVNSKVNLEPFSRLVALFSFVQLKQPIICVMVRINTETLQDTDPIFEKVIHDTYPKLKIEFMFFDINGKEKHVKDLTKLLKNYSDISRISLTPTCNKLVEELQLLDLSPGIVELDYIKLVMDTMAIKEDTRDSVLETLQRMNYIFTFPTEYSTAVCNYTMHYQMSRPHKNHFCLVASKIVYNMTLFLSLSKTTTGLQPPDFLNEIDSMGIEQQEYLLVLLEYFHVIFVLRKQFFEKLGMSEEYDTLYRIVNSPGGLRQSNSSITN